MADTQVTITAEEQEYLRQVLEWALKETKIEEHRTRTPSFREHIVHREEVINSLLKKIGAQPK
jgi:hypothetical protein